MPNEQLIDQVITDAPKEQIAQLTKLLEGLDIQMSTNIKTANQLNVAVLNAKSFGDYSKAAQQAQIGLEKIQQAQNKTAETTIKLDQAKQKAADAEAARMAKAEQARIAAQAKQDAADQKEIAAAEKKAAKLKAIRDDSGFPVAQEPFNAVTQDTGNVRYEPQIGNDPNISAGLAAQTAAREADTAASLQQSEALAALDVEYKANLELLNALRAEQTANALALKELNTETVAGVEQQTLLTAEQFRLKTEIAGVTLELNRQTKEMLAATGSMTELDASVLRLRTAYEQLSIQERESTEGQAMLASLQKLDAENKALAVSTGNTSKEVGAYEKAIAKATNGSQLAATAVNVATRSMIRMLVQFALFGVIFEAAQALYEYIKALNIFNPIASEAEMRQKALSDAFDSADYSKGIESTEKLAANLDLAKKGFVDSDTVINEYNETIGKTFGYVNNLNDAQKGFIENSDKYIKAAYLEAAAQLILADSAKSAAETAQKNQLLRVHIAQLEQEEGAIMSNASKNTAESTRNLLRQVENMKQGEIDQVIENNKRQDESYKNSLKVIEGFYKDRQKIFKSAGVVGDGLGNDAAADLRTKIANEELEREKIIAQHKINNDKLSYAERLKAVNAFYAASEKIEENNTNNQVAKLPKNDARIEDIEKEHSNKILQLEQQRIDARMKLNDAAYKQDQEHLKNSLEAQRDIFKQVLNDPSQAYDVKLAALKFYTDKSKEIIAQAQKEAVTEAGKNTKSITLANDAAAKAQNELAIQTAQERLRILKEEYQKVAEMTKEGEEAQLEILTNAADQVIIEADKAKNKRLNALDKLHADGKISERKYNAELFAINHEYNLKRIAEEIVTEETIIGMLTNARDKAEAQMKAEGANPDDIAKFDTEQNKQIQGHVKKRDTAIVAFQDEQGKSPSKKGKDDQKKLVDEIERDTLDAIDAVDKMRQKAFEAEIARLEKMGEMIDENAINQKAIIQDSILSEKTKAREIALLDKQTANAKRAIQVEENQIKNKEARADKEAGIAKIIVETAASIVKASPNPILIALAAAVGAVELATAIAAPLPHYAKGGKWQPGLGIWGEAGVERANLPDGSVRYSTGTELASFPVGTIITPHNDLMRQIKPEPINYAGGEQIGWGEVIKQLKKMEKGQQVRNVVRVNIDGNFEEYKRSYLRR